MVHAVTSWLSKPMRKPEALAACSGIWHIAFDNGQPIVDALGTNTDLNKPFIPSASIWNSSNSMGSPTPRPTTATAIRAPWSRGLHKAGNPCGEQQTGTKVDGVIAIDPVVLSYILGATGPVVMPDGETVTQDNVVELTESTLRAIPDRPSSAETISAGHCHRGRQETGRSRWSRLESYSRPWGVR